MRYALAFGLLGLSLGVTAASSAAGSGTIRRAEVVEAYLASTLLTLAGLYASRQAGLVVEPVLRRRVLRPIMLPYRALAVLTLGVARLAAQEDPRDEVAPGLRIGRLPWSGEARGLADDGITAILDLCAELPDFAGLSRDSRFTRLHRPILDGMPPRGEDFRVAVAWLSARRAEGRGILIHCAQGHGRSATIAAASLCRLGLAPDPDVALMRIATQRPAARLSRGQRLALGRFLEAAPGEP